MAEKAKTENQEDFSPQSENNPEEIIRKASRVVLHAAEKGRRSLFEKLTAKNADRMARIAEQKPIFWENQQDAKTEILLQTEMGQAMPPEFFENPTKWIESQKNIERHYGKQTLPTGETIDELWEEPYDISKVKEFSIIGKDGKQIKVVSKRIKPEETEEIALATKAFEAGIPTPAVLGEITDKGNIYAFFEKIDGIDLKAALEKKKIIDSRWVTGIFFATTNEDSFLKEFDEMPFKDLLSGKGKDEILNYWKKAREDFILENEISVHLDKIFSHISMDYLEEVREYMKDIESDERLDRKDIDRIVKKYGYDSFDDLKKKIEADFEAGDLEKYEKLAKKADKKREYFRKKVGIFDEELRRIIFKDIFGVDIEEEMKKLEKMCREKGIEHKDFADRNILIEWDFEKDEPKGKSSGDTKLYIIDWEARSKSEKTKKK